MTPGPASYRNYEHYIREGWAEQPKRTFVRLADLLAAAQLPPSARLLDIGCATGELIKYLQARFPGFSFTGVDVFEPLLAEARQRVPEARFAASSALDLPVEMDSSFDAVTAVGVISLFDEVELPRFWQGLLRVIRPGGRILALGPLNEYGVDCMIRHRKRIGGKLGEWETGWNIHSRETVGEILEGRCRAWRFHDFQIDLDLARRADPVRTWTMRTEANERQLTNGLKLLLDLCFIEVER
ncbi:MAG: class I SAM-dependent methyltransferase [Vicinamibacteria bacterium]